MSDRIGGSAASALPKAFRQTADNYAVEEVALSQLAQHAAATFTPAAASHVAGDVVGGAQQFSNIGPSGGYITINSVTLEIDGATIETTAWKLYLYSVTPPSALADDAAFDLPSGDRASFLGYVDIPQVVDLGATLWIESHNIGKRVKLAGTSLFGYLVNGTTLTPAAVAHIVTLHVTAG